MRHVSVAELKANAEELIAAAEAGEEIAIMREGEGIAQITIKARATTDRRTPEQKERQRRAVDAAYVLGQEILRTQGPTSSAERRAWIEDGRA